MREGWVETTLGDVITIERSRIDPRKLAPDSIYVGLENLESGRPTLGSFGRLGDIASSATPFVPDDVLFGKLRPYLRKVAIAEVSGFSTTELLVMRATSQLLPRFLLYLATQPSTFRYCEAASAGTRMPRVSAKDLSAIAVTLPPLAEQRRIVDVIESVDNYIAALETRAETARTARSALLHNLLSNPGPDWTKTKFGEVAQFVRGPFGRSLKKSIFVDAGYAVYEQQHAISGDLAEARYFIDQEKFDSMQRFHLLPKDIIMSCSGTVGRVAIAPEELARGVINQALLKVSANPSVNPHYLYTWMSSDWFQREIGANKGGGVQQNITSVAVLKKIPISVPPLAIQIEISEIADTTGNQIAALFAYSNKLRNLRSALLSDLLSGNHEIPTSYDELLGAA